MIVVGAVLFMMAISSIVVVAACMLSSRGNQELKQGNSPAIEVNGRWAGTSFGGKYTSNVSHFRFEPEELEDIQVVRHF